MYDDKESIVKENDAMTPVNPSSSYLSLSLSRGEGGSWRDNDLWTLRSVMIRTTHDYKIERREVVP